MTAMHHIDGYKLLNFASQIDDNTIEQAKETAAMPFVHPHIALMPDAHSGKGSAVAPSSPPSTPSSRQRSACPRINEKDTHLPQIQ